MATSSPALMHNGNHPAKPLYVFSLSVSATALAQERLNSYMGERNGGGDPVTALGVRAVPPELSVSQRQLEVQQHLQSSLTQYQGGTTSGI